MKLSQCCSHFAPHRGSVSTEALQLELQQLRFAFVVDISDLPAASSLQENSAPEVACEVLIHLLDTWTHGIQLMSKGFDEFAAQRFDGGLQQC